MLPMCVDVDECASHPCLHGGTCVDSISSTDGKVKADIFVCKCLPDYAGTTCATLARHPCVSAPCKHGGTCIESSGTQMWSCKCAPSYSGKSCETCVNDASWVDKYLGMTCAAYAKGGMSHDSCLVGAPSLVCVTACDSDRQSQDLLDYLVQHISHDVVRVRGPSRADESMSGIAASIGCPMACETLCGVDFDECASKPCQNGGTCLESKTDISINRDDFVCTCASTWTGHTCSLGVRATTCRSAKHFKITARDHLFNLRRDVSYYQFAGMP